MPTLDINTMTREQLIAALKAKSANRGKLSMKVSTKGGASLYGLGRFPLTLYRSQWEAVLGHVDAIKAFLETNAEQLASKDDAADETGRTPAA